MSTTSISVKTDRETKTGAQQIFKALGLDMTTAVNLFLRETVSLKGFPFALATSPNRTAKLAFGRGCMKGKIWMAEDFDAPLDDFKEYTDFLLQPQQ